MKLNNSRLTAQMQKKKRLSRTQQSIAHSSSGGKKNPPLLVPAMNFITWSERDEDAHNKEMRR